MSSAFDISDSSTASRVDMSRPPGGGRTGIRAASVRDGSAVVVTVGGELDASNVESWSFLLSKLGLATTPPGPFVIDVRNVRFMARGAFLSLAREAQGCRRRGFNLYLVSNRPVVARTVAACGLRPVLLVLPTVEAALSLPQRPAMKVRGAAGKPREFDYGSVRRPPKRSRTFFSAAT